MQGNNFQLECLSCEKSTSKCSSSDHVRDGKNVPKIACQLNVLIGKLNSR